MFLILRFCVFLEFYVFSGELGGFLEIWIEGLKTIISSKFLFLFPICS